MLSGSNNKLSSRFSYNVKESEEKILKFWKSKNIPEKVRKLRRGGKKFYFLDGPPYATGYIHMGTALNKILKDTYIRFFRMLGYDVWDQPGYDTHGLPIENKVEQKLGFKGKADIEKFGVKKFIEECRKYATQFIDVMNEQFENLGVWMDWKNPYLTLTNEYIEGAWATFKKGFEKGLLFKGKYPVHVCSHCVTAVAYNEIEYKTVSDPSIYVKFKVEGKENEYLLIWTTTPWTLAANTGVMVKPTADYARVKVNNEILIIAKDLVETVMNKTGIEDYEIVGIVKGKDLEGLKYEHPLADIFTFQKILKNAHRVVLSEQFVTLDEGTGLVHTAPGHGQEDYKVGLEYGLPDPSPVNMDGTYTNECGKFSGMYVKEADPLIIEELRNRGLLLHEEKISHEYPHCWRCKSPLLLISVPQWFFRVTGIRKKLLEENEKVKWIPKWAGERFRNWLESLGDWPISRQRYWGIPLPIWICESCNHVIVVGSTEEIEKMGGVVPKDLHKPEIDKVKLKCPKCGGIMHRVPDVLDVWFDSGVCSWASLGYPKHRDLFERLWPADLNIEGPDQIRGWWNSQLITSIITFDRAPFKTILFHGFVLDAHGVKMSKSLGNIIAPEDVIKEYGRDILRFYLLSKPPWDDFYFNMEEVKEIARNFEVLRNTFVFVKTYVNEFPRVEELEIEDRWILSKLNSLIKEYRQNMKKFHNHKATQALLDFMLNDFSRWYIKLIRDRVWLFYEGKDKRSAFYTLLKVVETVVRLLAPICPFLAEKVYQEVVKAFVDGEESVHMLDMPEANEKLIDKSLEKSMQLLKEVVEASFAARQKAKLKLRWPVRSVVIVTKDNNYEKSIKALESVFKRIANAKKVVISKKEPKGEFSSYEFSQGKVFVDLTVDEDLQNERMLRELIRGIQSLRKKYGFDVKERINLTLKSDEKTEKVLKNYSKLISIEVGASKVVVGKLEGKFRGNIKFKEVEIDIGFEKS